MLSNSCPDSIPDSYNMVEVLPALPPRAGFYTSPSIFTIVEMTIRVFSSLLEFPPPVLLKLGC